MHSYEYVLIVVFAFCLPFFINWVFKRHSSTNRKLRDEIQKKHEADRIKKVRDHQLNHGRMIYNWLAKELKQFENFGIAVDKIEYNGGRFTIFIIRKNNPPYLLPEDLLQVSFDFVGLTAPYQGHIHYERYGADILFWVADHDPKAGLDRLVLDEIRRKVAIDIEIEANRLMQQKPRGSD